MCFIRRICFWMIWYLKFGFCNFFPKNDINNICNVVWSWKNIFDAKSSPPLAARFRIPNKILENINETRLQILLGWLMILVCVLFEESVFEWFDIWNLDFVISFLKMILTTFAMLFGIGKIYLTQKVLRRWRLVFAFQIKY